MRDEILVIIYENEINITKTCALESVLSLEATLPVSELANSFNALPKLFHVLPEVVPSKGVP